MPESSLQVPLDGTSSFQVPAVQRASRAIRSEAANGAEAIQKAKEVMPDLVILDLAMPTKSNASWRFSCSSRAGE
jgi:CheY-like chemotaxis protein